MKGKKCIGLLILCITCLLSLNLFSNASAVTLTIDVNPTGYEIKNPTLLCLYMDNTQIQSTTNSCDLSTSAINVNDLKYISTVQNIPMKKGYYYRAIFSISSQYADGLPYSLWNLYTSNNFSIMEINEITNDNNQTNIKYILDSECTRTSYLQGSWICEKEENVIYSKFYEVTLRHISDDANRKFVIGTTNNFYLFYSGGNSYINAMPKITFYKIDEFEQSNANEVAEKELEDRDNLENQSTSTDNQANNAGQSAENTGTTLFAAFSQFFNALTNVSGASCVLPNMQVYSLNLGQMDLCTYDIPPQIMALVSIGMVFIIVPLGIHLVKRMLSLYKEITG